MPCHGRETTSTDARRLDRSLDRRLSHAPLAPSGASRRTPRLTTRATCARSPTTSSAAISPTGSASTASTCACSRRARMPAGLSRAACSAACRRCAASSTTCVRERVVAEQSRRGRPRAEGRASACRARSTSTSSTSCSTSRPKTRSRCATSAIMELFYSSGLRLDELVGLDLRAPRSRRPHGARARQGLEDAHRARGPQGATTALRAWLRERAALADRR